MAEPKWITESVAVYIHDDQIASHGGSYGILNPGLLSSAIAPLRNQFEYKGVVSCAKLAASYGYGLVKNHPFVDGNKRTAFQVMFAFLRINGLYLDAPESEVVIVMQQVAEGKINQEQLAVWIESFL
jgi:death on curing protein